jgi:hypothetical protein
MKWIVIFLIPLSCLAGSKQDDYVSSCEASFQRLILAQHPSKKDEAKEVAKESCRDMAKNLTDRNKWASVSNPKLEACSDAIYMLFDGADSKSREKIIARFCF